MMLRQASLALLLLLAGCAAIPPAVPPDKALVHIYRRAQPPNPADIAVFDGTRQIGALPEGSYLDYLTDPGPRVFKAEAPNAGNIPYATSLAAGQTYWFMVYILGDQLRGNAAIAPMDQATAEKQMATLKPKNRF